jgi:hypothetical protein
VWSATGVSSAVLLAWTTVACAGATGVVRVPSQPPSAQQLAQLWVDPGPQPRDLFYGVGGREFVPPADARYTFKGKDELGFSVSYDVVGPKDIEWSAKIGPEAQTEVVVSRILWGLGYHQPPLHYLPSWNLVLENGEIRKESEARFRPKLDRLDRSEYWSWKDNPFVGTQPFKGLLVVLLMFNSTDLKDDNNSIYEVKAPIPGARPDVRRWFVVRDLGAALGETGKLFPRRNWIEGFEKEGFIDGVEDGRIEFAFTGRHRQLLRMITPHDLRWAAMRLRRLTDQQWRDAFRAANYSDAIRDRYRRRIDRKIEEALEVAAAAQATPDA